MLRHVFVGDVKRGECAKMIWYVPFQCAVAADPRALEILWGWAAAVKAPALQLQWQARQVTVPVSRQQAGLHCRSAINNTAIVMLSLKDPGRRLVEAGQASRSACPPATCLR